MNWSAKLRLFEVIIAGVIPFKLCLADLQMELFTRSSSAVPAVTAAAAKQIQPEHRASPLDDIAAQVRGWKSADDGAKVTTTSIDHEEELQGSTDRKTAGGIIITEERHNPKFDEKLTSFIFSKFSRLTNGEE